jgi:hypothetical protein
MPLTAIEPSGSVVLIWYGHHKNTIRQAVAILIPSMAELMAMAEVEDEEIEVEVEGDEGMDVSFILALTPLNNGESYQ